MIRAAVTHPFQGAWKTRLFIGGTAVALSWTLVPLVVLVGYFSHTLAVSSVGADRPPVFRNYRSLIRNGVGGGVVLATVASLLLSIPLIAFPHILSVLAGVFGFNEASVSFRYLVYGFGLFVMLIGLFLPVLLCQHGRQGIIDSMEQLKTLVTVSTSIQMLRAIGMSLALTVGVTALFGAVVVFTFGIGLVGLPGVIFWLLTAISHLYGRAFGMATETLPHKQLSTSE